MKHPNPSKVRELANIFLTLANERPDAEVDMGEYKFNSCCTIACHAGWFGIAMGKECGYDYGFSNSAEEMANFLGFDNRWRLEIWARDNPKLWGNRYGLDMFSDREAFGLKDREPTLKEIGKHWHKVANRIEGLK